MRDMTDEEYAALDKRLTDTVPTLGPNGTGFFHARVFRLLVSTKKQHKFLTQKPLLPEKPLLKLLPHCFAKN
jgi:hypothetical protein